MKKLGLFIIATLAMANVSFAENATVNPRFSEEYRQGFVKNCVNESENKTESYCACVVDELPNYISEAEIVQNELRKATDHTFGRRWAETVVDLEMKASVPCMIKQQRGL